MGSLQTIFKEPKRFAIGIELVSTRGTMAEESAVKSRHFINQLSNSKEIDWVSITDNAGGNPMLAPAALGKPLLYNGKEVVIHLSCKDFNRNGLESEAWHLHSEGFNNILVLSGDLPSSGHKGQAKPVFDIDSVSLLRLLQQMNSGLNINNGGKSKKLEKTHYFLGAVVNNFKYTESEIIPQYLKLKKKIECGAQFIINQIGFDSRKCIELIQYIINNNLQKTMLIGNTYLLNAQITKSFSLNKIPGVFINKQLLNLSLKQTSSSDKGKAFFQELAAKQMALYRGLGYKGVYLGGINDFKSFEKILELEKSYAPQDWKEFAKEISYSRPKGYFIPKTKIKNKHTKAMVETKNKFWHNPFDKISYRIYNFIHTLMFTSGQGLDALFTRYYSQAKNSKQGPTWMRCIELYSKSTLFSCKDCGDCSLQDTAFLCPESQCAKNQRNGPCGGSFEGLCEANDRQCIWCRAYERLKKQNKEMQLLKHAPVLQDQSLRGTSSWANKWLNRDHHSKENLCS